VGERWRNLRLDGAPTLPAVDRYTGVLYDPIGDELSEARARAWLHGHVVVQSAMFGPVRGGDPLPAYRLSHDSRLGVLRLAAVWRDSATRVLEEHGAGGLVLDLRSEGYRALGPLSSAVPLRVVSEGGGGRRRALNHGNKTAKGRLVAVLARAQAEPTSMAALASWARTGDIVIEETTNGWEMIAETLPTGGA
jgi:cytoplasmic iron level regulating protein YaaA (DUF328/UPF0246 family)